MKKRVAILGSTGVVGRAAVELLGDTHEIVGLSAYSDIAALQRQGERFPKAKLSLKGEEVIEDADLVIVALSGISGLEPTARALRAGKELLIASKEVLVAGGKALQRLGAIVPIDTELLGVRDCLRGRSPDEVVRVTLSASGGPFWRRAPHELHTITPEEATRHPTCQVGRKSSVDCALLLNKGFELISAHLLFGIPPAALEAMIHPQGILQCGVTFRDGAVTAAFMPPSIEHALKRAVGLPVPLLPFPLFQLECFPVDVQRFPCFQLAQEALHLGGTALPLLVAASEALVERFLQKEISYTSIAERLEKLLLAHKVEIDPSLAEIISLAAAVKEEARYF